MGVGRRRRVALLRITRHARVTRRRPELRPVTAHAVGTTAAHTVIGVMDAKMQEEGQHRGHAEPVPGQRLRRAA